MDLTNQDSLKVIIIGFYYGEFPKWFPYWLRSCADNPTIDFLLITDIDTDALPQNVKKIRYTLKEIKELCQQKLEMKVSLERPYKLCDYKPLYGLILEEYIQDYDYWGHCDFDLIWGDIRAFINLYDITKYDKFLPLGHLALYRNTESCNHYFELEGSKCGDYKTVLTQDSNFAFDETGGIYSIYEYNGLPMFTKRIFAEIKTFHKRFRLKACDRNYKHQVFYYEDGKIYRAYKKGKEIAKEEFIYIHFRRKLSVNPEVDWKTIDAFFISPNGFFTKKRGTPTLGEIEEYNHNPGWGVEIWETAKFCFRNLRNIRGKVKNEIVALKQNKS